MASLIYFERFPSKEAYEGCKRLKELYPASRYPRLNAQWDKRILAYETAQLL